MEKVDKLLERREKHLREIENEKQEAIARATAEISEKYSNRIHKIQGRNDQIIAEQIPSSLKQDYLILNQRAKVVERAEYLSALSPEERTKAEKLLGLLENQPDEIKRKIYRAILTAADKPTREAVILLRRSSRETPRTAIHSLYGVCDDGKGIIIHPINGESKSDLAKKLEERLSGIEQVGELHNGSTLHFTATPYRFGDYTSFIIRTNGNQNVYKVLEGLREKVEILSEEILGKVGIEHKLIQIPCGVVERLIHPAEKKPEPVQSSLWTRKPYGKSSNNQNLIEGTSFLDNPEKPYLNLMQAYHRLGILQANGFTNFDTTDIAYVFGYKDQPQVIKFTKKLGVRKKDGRYVANANELVRALDSLKRTRSSWCRKN